MLPKVKRPDAEIVASLEKLKKELERREKSDPTAREILFKINSCLFSKYPHH